MCESTAIYESLGDSRALALVNRLFALLQQKVTAGGGAVVKTLGDGMVCQFPDADAAFRAACDMHAAASGLAPEAQHKLAIKTGFTYGPVVLSGGDVFGDTVNVCSRLVGLANPSQVLTTQQTVEALSPGLRTRCRQLYPLKVKGRAEEVTVCDVMWRVDPDVTEMNLTRTDLTQPGQWVLKLTYQGETYTVEPTAAIRLGRDKENEVVVASHLASRVNARGPLRARRPVLERHVPARRQRERGAAAPGRGGARRARLDRAGQPRREPRRSRAALPARAAQRLRRPAPRW